MRNELKKKNVVDHFLKGPLFQSPRFQQQMSLFRKLQVN
jgi:hypothetical protein